VVLTLDQVLVKDQVLIFFGDDEVGPVGITVRVLVVLDDVVEGKEVDGGVEVRSVLRTGISVVFHHRHRQRCQLLHHTQTTVVQVLLSRSHSYPEHIVPHPLLADGRRG
jgi:hypothetical protein